MVAVHHAQVLFAAIAIRRAFGKLYGLAWAHRIAPAEFTELAAASLARPNTPETTALLRASARTYLGEILGAAVDARRRAESAETAVEEAVLDARHRVVDGIRWIRGMATIASAAGLVGAMAHYFFPPVGSLGVRALSAAVVQDAANRGAMVSIVMGLGTAAVLHVCSSALRRAARARLSEIVAFAAELLEASE